MDLHGYRNIMKKELWNTGRLKYSFSIPDKKGELECVERAADKERCFVDVADPSGGKIVITITRMPDRF